GGEGGWRWAFPIASMTPKSSGTVRLRSSNPQDRPLIDHRYLQDPWGCDRAVLLAGIDRAREIIGASPLRELLGPELSPGPGNGDLAGWIDATCAHYYHPVGTCAMGREGDPAAVTDARGKVHGIDNLFVADCSIMPAVPRANTNIPAVVVGERVARWLLDA
ncbi:MAG: GMC oxidoreductase, partial [Thermomicrobiales bacterium]